MTRTRGVLLASAIALAALPSLASAQTRCEAQAHDKKVAGTVIGGVLGALAGNAIGRGGGRTGGTIIGGVAGAAVGNNLARTHCPDGYAEVQDPNYAPPPAYGDNGVPPPPPPQYDSAGFWRQAPQGIRQRIDWMQARIDRSRDRGSLDPRQANYAQRELGDIRRMNDDLRSRDGGHLSEPDRSYIQGRLDNLGQNLRWMRSDSSAGQ
jgi:hypothetical protein